MTRMPKPKADSYEARIWIREYARKLRRDAEDHAGLPGIKEMWNRQADKMEAYLLKQDEIEKAYQDDLQERFEEGVEKLKKLGVIFHD